MPEVGAGRKAVRVGLMIVNAAVDLLLPTVVLVALAPTGLSAAVLLSIGGTLLAGKAIGGQTGYGRFRWRLALLAGLAPTAAILGCHAAGLGDVPSMVAGSVVLGVIVLADVGLGRRRARTGGGADVGLGRRPGRSEGGVDVFALVVLVEVLAGVVLTSISGDARFVLARVSLYLAIGGLVILASAWAERPLMRTALKPVAAKGEPAREEAFERAWVNSRKFRALYRAMTAGLGGVLIVDAVLRAVIIYSQPAGAVVESSLTSQLPLVVLIAGWFAAGRGLAVPRAERILEAELARAPAGPEPPVPAATKPR
ncbi:VC0807 family protein [Amycolatopsis saalfeldensis]|uniref:Uncharacterized protein n=1 Tax=Amycolatopsis saalfeldensis TaxID=394193 RepID=A0A1H8UZN7_9PSEU|nr:VC0807 family protein [Amycolatopsis saalfeldensis]SEP08625.1 hypothetical protein SAMN04489732_103563 [Amycolatopsis saalfeldensis]